MSANKEMIETDDGTKDTEDVKHENYHEYDAASDSDGTNKKLAPETGHSEDDGIASNHGPDANPEGQRVQNDTTVAENEGTDVTEDTGEAETNIIQTTDLIKNGEKQEIEEKSEGQEDKKDGTDENEEAGDAETKMNYSPENSLDGAQVHDQVTEGGKGVQQERHERGKGRGRGRIQESNTSPKSRYAF